MSNKAEERERVRDPSNYDPSNLVDPAHEKELREINAKERREAATRKRNSKIERLRTLAINEVDKRLTNKAAKVLAPGIAKAERLTQTETFQKVGGGLDYVLNKNRGVPALNRGYSDQEKNRLLMKAKEDYLNSPKSQQDSWFKKAGASIGKLPGKLNKMKSDMETAETNKALRDARLAEYRARQTRAQRTINKGTIPHGGIQATRAQTANIRARTRYLQAKNKYGQPIQQEQGYPENYPQQDYQEQPSDEGELLGANEILGGGSSGGMEMGTPSMEASNFLPHRGRGRPRKNESQPQEEGPSISDLIGIGGGSNQGRGRPQRQQSISDLIGGSPQQMNINPGAFDFGQNDLRIGDLIGGPSKRRRK